MSYYKNIPVKIIAELPNDECVIEIIVGDFESYRDDYGYSNVESYPKTIIVEKNICMIKKLILLRRYKSRKKNLKILN